MVAATNVHICKAKRMTGKLRSGCSTNLRNEAEPRWCDSTRAMAFTLDIRVMAVSDSANMADRTMRMTTITAITESPVENWAATNMALLLPGGVVFARLGPLPYVLARHRACTRIGTKVTVDCGPGLGDCGPGLGDCGPGLGDCWPGLGDRA
jgi:hypothetical protein